MCHNDALYKFTFTYLLVYHLSPGVVTCRRFEFQVNEATLWQAMWLVVLTRQAEISVTI